ncbi:unnamed protein product [Boreogadus saida]
MMDDEKVKRKRKANWSQDQLLLLAQFVLERRGVIKGRFGAGVTSKKKREAWEEIRVNINASFPAVRRSTDDCEKRWYSLQSQCRRRICTKAVDPGRIGSPFLFQLHLPSHLVLFQLHLPSHLVLFQLHLLSQLFLSLLFLFQLSLLVHPLALLWVSCGVHCGRKN